MSAPPTTTSPVTTTPTTKGDDAAKAAGAAGAGSAAPAERPALLVDGPTSAPSTSAVHLSPITKLWLMAGGLAAAALALILLTSWYWRRTRPWARPALEASAGAIAPRSARRRDRRAAESDADDEITIDPTGDVAGDLDEAVRRAWAWRIRSGSDAVIDRRLTTAATAAPGVSTARWTGEFTMTPGLLMTSSAVPPVAGPGNGGPSDYRDLAGYPEAGERRTEASTAPARRWTGDRWSDCDPRLRATVSVGAE